MPDKIRYIVTLKWVDAVIGPVRTTRSIYAVSAADANVKARLLVNAPGHATVRTRKAD